MSIYDSVILDYYHHPLHKRVIDAPDVTCHVANQSCGDELTVMMRIVRGVVTDCAYQGHLCAVSTASASLLSEKVIGMRVAEVCELDMDIVHELLDVELTPVRLKCALLPLEAIQKSARSFHRVESES